MDKRNEFNAVYKPSSESIFIENFLKKNRIKFKTEFPIVDIKGGSNNYRKADFYLTNLKIYVEYFGWYNKSKEDRERCDSKAKEYIYNNLPTIFLYPHELGFLEYAFHTKLIKVLKIEKFKLRKQRWRYLMQRYWHNTRRGYLGTFLISSYGLFVISTIPTGLSEDMDILVLSLLLIFIIDGFIGTIKDINKYLIKSE